MLACLGFFSLFLVQMVTFLKVVFKTSNICLHKCIRIHFLHLSAPSAFPELCPVCFVGDSGVTHPLPAASSPQAAALVLLLSPSAQN